MYPPIPKSLAETSAAVGDYLKQLKRDEGDVYFLDLAGREEEKNDGTSGKKLLQQMNALIMAGTENSKALQSEPSGKLEAAVFLAKQVKSLLLVSAELDKRGYCDPVKEEIVGPTEVKEAVVTAIFEALASISKSLDEAAAY